MTPPLAADVGSDKRALIQVTEYKVPPLPAEERFKVWRARLRAMLGSTTGTAFIADDQLKATTLRRLDRAVAPPAAGPILSEIERSVHRWLEGDATAERLKAIVLPPCDGNDVVGGWAREQGVFILDLVQRAGDFNAVIAHLEGIDRDTLVVVPRLEQWFLREVGGLAPVRTLLAALDDRRQRTVIGCNAWAWAYLSKAIGIDLLVGKPLTFSAFDGARLREWFTDLANDDMTKGTRFRLVEGGIDVLSDQSDKSAAFFDTLAGRSRGIPWVAWHMWRRMLRTDRDASGETEGEPADETLWVAALDELVLPGDRPREALLILHTLLVHGTLTIAELRKVLPMSGETAIPAALVASGFLERESDVIRIRAEAYPAIHAGMETAGLPKGDL